MEETHKANRLYHETLKNMYNTKEIRIVVDFIAVFVILFSLVTIVENFMIRMLKSIYIYIVIIPNITLLNYHIFTSLNYHIIIL